MCAGIVKFEDGAYIEFILKSRKLVQDQRTPSESNDSPYQCRSRSFTKAADIRYECTPVTVHNYTLKLGRKR